LEKFRGAVSRSADLCILPNEKRLQEFVQKTGRTKSTELVWNVPSVEEVRPEKRPGKSAGPLRLFYGGSLSRERLPWAVLQVILGFGGTVRLDLVGYPNYDDRDYPEAIRAADAGKGTLTYHGTLPQRSDLFRIMEQCEAALCLMPMRSRYSGMEQMVGASNKPFDAMARGLAVVISDLPAWTSMYLEEGKDEAGAGGDPGCRIPDAGEKSNAKGTMSKDARNPEFRVPDPGKGYGVAIDPESGESIRAGLDWMLKNREELWEMGERGRQKIQKEWNYEKMFIKVAGDLSS
jgi:glycosyltransferase involved in cell wall biosynthesis